MFNDIYVSPGLKEKVMSVLGDMYPGKIFESAAVPPGTALMMNAQNSIAGHNLSNLPMNTQLFNNQLQAQNSIDQQQYQKQLMNYLYNATYQQSFFPRQQPPVAKRVPQWYDRYAQAADYDPNTDSITIRATGERVYQSAIEYGYKPHLTNLDWLEHQIQTVRNYAYKDTSARNIRPNRV